MTALKDARRKALDVPIRVRRRPRRGRRVRPPPAHESEDASSRVGERRVRKIPPLACSESDNRHDSSGPDQLRKPGQPFFVVDLMQGRNRYNRVERTRFERRREHIGVEPFDALSTVALSRAAEHARIRVEPDDVANAGVGQLCREDAVTTSDVEHALRVAGDHRENQRVVMNIRIPEHETSLSLLITNPRSVFDQPF